MLKLILTITVLLAMSICCLAQTPASSSSRGTVHLVVNGKSLTVLQNGGQLWVSIDELARSVNGTLTYGNPIVLAIPQLVASQPASQPAVGGEIKGTLTYYFNMNYGSRPDVGSRVVLVAGNVEIADSEFVMMIGSSLSLGSRKYPIVKQSIADGNGNFDLSGVLPGEYTLILKSAHAKGGAGQSHLTEKDFDGRVETKVLNMESGKTVDASHDFGISAF